MDKFLMYLLPLIMLASFVVVPSIITKITNVSLANKIIIYSVYIGVLVLFIVLLSIKNHFAVGSLFTYIIYFVSALVVVQAFAGVLGYIYLILKLFNINIPYPLITIFGVSAVVALFALYNGTQIKTKEVTIKMDNLSSDVTIMHLPDIHLGHYNRAKYLQRIVDISNSYSPDIVLLNGDLFEENYSNQPYVKDILSQFTGEVIFTQGNHELYVNYDEIKQVVNELGFKHLENESYNTHGLQLVGVDYLDADAKSVGGHPSPADFYLSEFLATISLDNTTPSILVHHTPVGAKYVAAAGFDLTVSGHTHGGGQMWPATLVGNFMFDYNKGLHEYENLKIYISEGAGKFGVPARLGTSNEINVIRLTK